MPRLFNELKLLTEKGDVTTLPRVLVSFPHVKPLNYKAMKSHQSTSIINNLDRSSVIDFESPRQVESPK
jgi:hypothetical protein